jgi:hypothetical protein
VEAALIKNGQIINGFGLKTAETVIGAHSVTQTLSGRHGTFTATMNAKGELITGTTHGATKAELGTQRGETTEKIANGNRDVKLPGEKVGGRIGIRDGILGLPVLILDGDKKPSATNRAPRPGGTANGAGMQIPADKLGEKSRSEDKNRTGDKVAADKEVRTVRPIIDLTFLGGRRIIDRDVRLGTTGGRTVTATGREDRNPIAKEIDNKQIGKRIEDRQIPSKRIEDRQIIGKRIEDRQIGGKRIDGLPIIGKRIEDRQIAGKRVEDKFTAARRIDDKLIPAARTNQDISRWLEEKLRSTTVRLLSPKTPR